MPLKCFLRQAFHVDGGRGLVSPHSPLHHLGGCFPSGPAPDRRRLASHVLLAGASLQIRALEIQGVNKYFPF